MQEIQIQDPILLTENLIRQFAGEPNEVGNQVNVPVNPVIVWSRFDAQRFNAAIVRYNQTRDLKWLEEALAAFSMIQLDRHINTLLENPDLLDAVSRISRELDQRVQGRLGDVVNKDLAYRTIWENYRRGLMARNEVFNSIVRIENINNLNQRIGRIDKFIAKHPIITAVIGIFTFSIVGAAIPFALGTATGYIIFFGAIGGISGRGITKHWIIRDKPEVWAERVRNLAQLEAQRDNNLRFLQEPLRVTAQIMLQRENSVPLNEQAVEQLFYQNRPYESIAESILNNRLSIDFRFQGGNSLLDMALTIANRNAKRNLVGKLVLCLNVTITRDFQLITELCEQYIEEVIEEDLQPTYQVRLQEFRNIHRVQEPESVNPSQRNEIRIIANNRFSFNFSNSLENRIIDFSELHAECTIDVRTKDKYILLVIDHTAGNRVKAANWANQIKKIVENHYSLGPNQGMLNKVDIHKNGNRLHIFPIHTEYFEIFYDFIREHILLPSQNTVELR